MDPSDSKFLSTLYSLEDTCPPIPLEKLRQVRKIIVHGGKCPDGRASAILLNYAYNGLVPIEFLNYGMREYTEMAAEPGLLFCDFCVPPGREEEFLEAGTIVLDHHKGAEKVVRRFVEAGQGVFADEKVHPGISGAPLAYHYVCGALKANLPVAARRLALLAGVRDTWQKRHPEWVSACEQSEALSFWPEHILLNSHVLHDPEKWSSIFDLGAVLWEKKCETAQKVGNSAYQFTSEKGTRVAIFQGARLTSDTTEVLGDEVDLVVGFDMIHEEGVFKVLYSTRSRGNYDCKSFCSAHGGGGHTSAAGFNRVINVRKERNPYELFRNILEAYESPSLWTRLLRKVQKRP